MYDIKIFLNKNYKFFINEINGRIYYKEKESKDSKKHKNTNKSIDLNDYELLGEYQLNSIFNKVKENTNCKSKHELYDLLNSDFVKKINPIQNYFKSLPEWDGKTDYIDELAKTVQVEDNEFFKKYLTKWLVGLTASVFNPTDVNQLVLVLVGKQGCGKTTWIENLLPTALKDYHYKGIINPENKDTKLSMGEFLIMNMDELSTYNQSKINAFKEMITLTGITERRPYARFTEKINRIASFTATSNDVEILIDLTGNRRFLCNKIIGKVDYNHSVDIDKVMAQTYALYNNGFKYYNNAKDNEEIELQNQNFMRSNPNKDWIFKVIEKPKEGDEIVKYTATEIYELMKNRGCKSNISNVEIGKILSNYDFDSCKSNGIKKYNVKVIN